MNHDEDCFRGIGKGRRDYATNAVDIFPEAAKTNFPLPFGEHSRLGFPDPHGVFARCPNHWFVWRAGLGIGFRAHIRLRIMLFHKS